MRPPPGRRSSWRQHCSTFVSHLHVLCNGHDCCVAAGNHLSQKTSTHYLIMFIPLIWEFPKIWGTFLGVPYDKDYSILGSILGPPSFGKLPYICRTTLNPKPSSWANKVLWVMLSLAIIVSERPCIGSGLVRLGFCPPPK